MPKLLVGLLVVIVVVVAVNAVLNQKPNLTVIQGQKKAS